MPVPGCRIAVLCALGAIAAPVAAQHRGSSVSLAGQAIAAFRHHDPVPFSRSLSELRIVQPFIQLRAGALDGRLSMHAIADFEGLTIPNGELTLGAWGEGFIDRRHPHTYLHELVLSFSQSIGPVRGSLSLGKGFVPFGTDDPMSRPALSYPANHHLSQILERAMVIVAVGAGPVVLEGSAFNGDEPDAPDAWPELDRFGDSYALRLTYRPSMDWETQVSHARVSSPEHRGGAGLDDTKWSVSARWAGALGRTPGTFLAEWARTKEGDAFEFETALIEVGAVLGGHHHPYVRYERTTRPEEERISAFRTRLPPIDDALLGVSRWTLWTAGYRRALSLSNWELEPFVEGTLARVQSVGGGIFDPEVYYGRRTLGSVAIGLRLRYRLEDHRMGRYGVALPTPSPQTHEH